MTTDLAVTVYTPESPLSDPRQLLRDMFGDLAKSRELAWRLFVRDTRAQYRQSVLGYVWAFLPSVATTMVFAFLNSQQILHVGETKMPYPAFVVIGTVLWQTFYDALNSPLRAVLGAKSMLAKINFPREALILAGVADVVFNFLIRVTLFIPVFLFYRIDVHFSILLAPLGVLGLLLFGLAIGMWVLPLGVLYNDVGRGLGLISSFWMLLTPVVYPVSKSGIGAVLGKYNPVSPVLQTTRDWISGQPAANLESFVVITVASLIALLGGWVLFRLALPHVIDRIGN
jgi:lipopolysaccharide transport system permease protein